MRVAIVPATAGPGPVLHLEPTASIVDLDAGPDAIVVPGDPGPVAEEVLEAVTRLVESGATLLAMGAPGGEAWEALTGVRRGEDVPGGEVFATVADHSQVTARSVGEFPVPGSFHWLEPAGGDGLTVHFTTSVRYRHRPAVVSHRVGRGVVVTSGFGPESTASEELRRALRRCLGGAAGDRVRTGRSGRAASGTGDLGVAVVGYGPFGGMGTLHGTAATETDGLRFVAALDTAAERRKAAEDEFPGITAYGDLDALLADDTVDVVVVATPPSSHASLAMDCLRAGKHVAVEKPLCITTEEADALLAEASTHDLMLTVHQNRRWDADYRALRRAVDAGLVGEVFNFETFVGGFEHPCRAWHSERDVSGGAIYDWGSHHLDWILLLFGDDPTTVTTTRHKRVWHDITNDDQVRVRLAWADGREAEFLQSDIAGVRRPKFYLQGTEGTIAGHYRPFVVETVEHGLGYQRFESHHAEAPVELTLARYERGYGLTETRLPPLPASPWPFHRNLADHLLLGEPLEVDAADVRKVIGVLEAAQRSGDEGGTTLALDLSGDPVTPGHERVFRPDTAPDVDAAGSAPVRFGVLAPSSMVARLAVMPAIEASKGAELVATASRAAGERYEDVLADESVEAVYLPLPNGLHREWVEAAAAAGKHVLCEKPLALTAADARAMAQACDGAGVVLLEAYMTPYHPRTVALHDLVASGRLGRLVSIRTSFTFAHQVPTDHRWDPDLGGGALADLGVYVLTPLFELAAATGRPVPESVTTNAVLTAPDERGRSVDVTTTGTIGFPDGLTATFECSFDAPEAQTLEVTGTQGRVRVEHAFTPDSTDAELVVQRRDGSLETIDGLGGDCYRGMVDHFCAVVRGRVESRRPAAMSVAFAELCDRIRAGRA